LAAKEAAEAGNRAKSEFLANMSHEMRTPLAGVLGMIELVLDMEIGAEERELLEMAQRSATSLLRIIADVLDFSRIEAGVMRFERKRFVIAEVLGAASEVVSFSAKEKGLELSWEIEGSLPEHMVGDPGRVRQVLVNLLGNAVKFTETGRIDVTVHPYRDPACPEANGIAFSIKDTGAGIAADQLERIFGKFTQVETSLTRRYGGTGWDSRSRGRSWKRWGDGSGRKAPPGEGAPSTSRSLTVETSH
jgi:signal transduction histidine kinase